ncbi:MAG: DUF4062 domain-containing protein [Cyanobacteriota bacterium]
MAEILQLFLSCMSGEFRSYRDKLRKGLRAHNLAVQIQEELKAGGVSTLEKLDRSIQQCDAVIHLVGKGVGSLARPRSLAYMRTTYPDLTERYPVLEEFLDPSKASLSYTQWEAWLALLHGKMLLICTAGEDAPRESNFTPQAADCERQMQHLMCLREKEAYAEIKFRNSDELRAEILLPLFNRFYCLKQFDREWNKKKCESNSHNPPAPALNTLSLMVLVHDSLESNLKGKRYCLTPELHPSELNNMPLLSQINLEPQDNIVLNLSDSHGRYIGDCLKEWLSLVRALAQDIASRNGGAPLPEVLLEMFLPADLLLLDCGGLQIPSTRRMRPMASRCSFVVRSLDRARDQVNSRSFLEDKWKGLISESPNAGLLLVTNGPPEAMKNDPEQWDDWHEQLLVQASDPGTQVCVYLPDPIEDLELRAVLIDALIDANLPLVLVWPGGQRSAGVDPNERLALLQRLLHLDPQVLPTTTPGSTEVFHRLETHLNDVSLSKVAMERKKLLGDPACSQAVVVMDVPDHWPQCLPTRQPCDQLRPPS